MTPTLEFVIIVAICVIVVFTVLFFMKISKTLDSVQANLDQLTGSFAVAVKDIGEIKSQAVTSMQMIDKSAIEFIEVTNDIQEQIRTISGTFDPLIGLVNAVTERVSPPVMQMTGMISAASKAINAFVNRLSR